jgi:hypothetical protein
MHDVRLDTTSAGDILAVSPSMTNPGFAEIAAYR